MSDNKNLALSLGLAAGICYLTAHALSGQQGLPAYIGLQAEERALTAERDALAAEIEALSDRAERLRVQSLDRDFLDERARDVLGAAAPQEVVFLQGS